MEMMMEIAKYMKRDATKMEKEVTISHKTTSRPFPSGIE
jgi:hypothetical protein